MKVKTILFDLDNTLVRCMMYYNFIRKNLFLILSKESGMPMAEIESLFEEIESVRINKLDGFTRRAFIDSINLLRVEIYAKLRNENEELANKFYQSDVSFKLINFAASVYEAPYTAYDEVPEVLGKIRETGISMYVVTKGSFYGQSRKASMFGEIFDGLFVLPRKDVSTWSGVVESMQLDRDATMVVGDSIKDDINPAIHNKLLAVRIDRHSTNWIGDPKVELMSEVKCISSLNELLELL